MLLLSNQENGVDSAIQCMYRDLEYAKSLVRAKAGKHATHSDADADDEEEPEENWTFVGGDDAAEHMQQSLMLDAAVAAAAQTPVGDFRTPPLGLGGGDGGDGGETEKALPSRIISAGAATI